MTKRVAILLMPGFSLMSFAATYEPLRKAREIVGQACFDLRVLGQSDRMTACDGRKFDTDGWLSEFGDPLDAVIVCASLNSYDHWTPTLSRYLNQQAKRGSLIGGVDGGPWILAQSGLLDGITATIHWTELVAFSQQYPNVDVRGEGYVLDGSILTTSGGTATLSAMIRLIKILFDGAVSLEVAHLFNAAERDQRFIHQQTAYIQRLASYDPDLANAVSIMKLNIAEPISISAVAQRTGVSQRTLTNMFQKHLRSTPQQAYMSERLSLADRLVIDTNMTITDIAAACGFKSINSFDRAFRRQFQNSASARRRGMRRAGEEQAHFPSISETV